MSKYLCTCGKGFRSKIKAVEHLEIFSNIQNSWHHQLMQRHWKGRFLDFLIDNRKYWKLTGITIIYFTVINHFGIALNLWEGLAMGFGMGLAID